MAPFLPRPPSLDASAHRTFSAALVIARMSGTAYTLIQEVQ
jgi:hypothetical protein